MSRAKSGGGLTLNKLVRPGVKTGPARANVMNPKGVSQLGTAVDAKSVEPLQSGSKAQVPLGNALATNVGRGGPGTGRVTYASGSQGTHGAVNRGEATAPAKDILGQFGPERRNG
jgi:hypothetical protein